MGQGSLKLKVNPNENEEFLSIIRLFFIFLFDLKEKKLNKDQPFNTFNLLTWNYRTTHVKNEVAVLFQWEPQ